MQHNLFKNFSSFSSHISISLKTWGVVFFVMLVSFLVGLSVGVYYLVEPYHGFNMISYGIASILNSLPIDVPGVKLPLDLPSGETIKYIASEYKNNRYLQAAFDTEKSDLIIIVFSAAGFSVLLTVLFFKYFIKILGSATNSKFIRGASIILDKQMVELIKRRDEITDYFISILPIPESKLRRHMGLFGDTGVGKSVSIMQLLDVFREKNEKAFIVDKSGEFIQHYYNPETDIILSPFDDRSAGWLPFYEAYDLQDFERLARSFIPTVNNDTQNDHWPEASVTVLTWLLFQLNNKKANPDIDDIISILTLQSEDVKENLLGDEVIVKTRKLNELLSGTLAELLIDPSSPEHTNGVIASITPKIRALYYLRGLEKRTPFSIRDWVNDDTKKGWVFVRVSEDQLDAVNPLITAWIDTFIKTVISLPKSQSRVVHCVIDELQSFDKINTLSKAVFEGRKHGLRMMLGFTSVMELIGKYGEHSIKAILSMLNTKVIFLTSEPDAAEWCAKVLGEEDVKLDNQTISAGTNDNISMGDNRTKQYVVMPAEVQMLPDLQAYVRFSGDWPITKIKNEWKDRPIVAEHFVKRTLPVPVRAEALVSEPEHTEEDLDSYNEYVEQDPGQCPEYDPEDPWYQEENQKVDVKDYIL